MPRIVRTEAAQRDLEAILDYLDSQGSDAADRFAGEFDEKCELHAQYPNLGPSAGEYAPGLRCFVVRNYAVFYRSIEDGIEIVRILHGARDIPRIFQ